MKWPEHRLGRVARLRVSNVDKLSRDDETPVRLCNYVDVYKNDAITGDLDFMQATATPAQIASFRLSVGDTVFTKDSETADDIGVPAYVAEAGAELVCGYHLAIATPDQSKVDPRFLFWAMSSTHLRDQWIVLASGVTRVGLRSDDLGKAGVPVPPLDEQRRIADFLDTELKKVDAVASLDASLRGLLRVRLDRLVFDEVRGLVDRSAEASPGPRWLGPVHAGWPVVALQRVARMHSGTSFPHAYQGEAAGDFPFVKVGDFALAGPDLSIGDAGNWITRSTARTLGAHVVPVGSVLTARVGAALLLNQRRLLTRPAVVDDNVRGLEFFAGSSEYWLNLLTLVSLEELANPGPVPSISGSQLLALEVAVPPLSEQAAIGARCTRLRVETAAAVAAMDRRAHLVAERRQALITAAVTGQFDVTTARGVDTR